MLRWRFTVKSKSQIGMDNKDKIENMEKESLHPILIRLLLWLLRGHPGKIKESWLQYIRQELEYLFLLVAFLKPQALARS